MSLSYFQHRMHKIYGQVNDRNYDNHQFVSRLHRYVAHILKSVRKSDDSKIRDQLCWALAWTLALATRLRIPLERRLLEQYPGVCPYCGESPCACSAKRAQKRMCVRAQANLPHLPEDLSGYQKMFAAIYPNNTTKDAAFHLAEEVGEVDEALDHYSARHDPALFPEIELELVDVVANLCGVATCLRIDLGHEMVQRFKEGCVQCGSEPCACGYTIPANTVEIGRPPEKVAV